jgi:hypothetical protein
MSKILFSYQITYKAGVGHTPFQLVYGLHPSLPTEYMLPSRPSENKDPNMLESKLVDRLS